MTVRVALLRHAPTGWNAAKRLQGRTDVPISADGRAAAAAWRLPAAVAGFAWLSSPLLRCRQTAAVLGAPADIPTDARLAEMSWGIWEGRTLAELRAEFGPAMQDRERLGLDFRAGDGESPRMVQDRLRPLLADLAVAGQARLLMTHKGVMRAMLALATGWDMTGRPPVRMLDACVQLFRLDATGAPAVDSLNLPLQPRPAAAVSDG